MIVTDRTLPATPPPGCIVDDDGAWIFDTTVDHVESAADRYGRPVVTVGGHHACVRVVGDQVVILRAAVEL